MPTLKWGQGKGVDGAREGNRGLSLRAAVPGRVSPSPGPVSRPLGLTSASRLAWPPLQPRTWRRPSPVMGARTHPLSGTGRSRVSLQDKADGHLWSLPPSVRTAKLGT